ncbi:MAG: ABC transporter permease [Pseudomonadota bacterium]
MIPPRAQPLAPLPLVNWMGVRTLFWMELRRYLKAWPYAIGAPVLTTLLFLAVFDLALGDLRRDIDGVPFLVFLAPGLVAMTVMTTAFEITGWSTIDAKIRGTIQAQLSAPLRPTEFVGAHVLAGAVGGLVNGLLVVVAMQPFIAITPIDLGLLLYFTVTSALFMASVGIAAGIQADKYDHVATIMNFLITPMIFLSGVFFPVSAYSPLFADLAHLSPFFWIIDGARHGYLGVGEAPLLPSMVLTGAMTIIALIGLTFMVARGYKLKQ